MEHLFLFIRLAFAMGLALFFGRHIARIKLPAILAWLISGMILGPYALNLMNLELFESTNFQILSSIIETSVGLMIGTELVIDKAENLWEKDFDQHNHSIYGDIFIS